MYHRRYIFFPPKTSPNARKIVYLKAMEGGCCMTLLCPISSAHKVQHAPADAIKTNATQLRAPFFALLYRADVVPKHNDIVITVTSRASDTSN